MIRVVQKVTAGELEYVLERLRKKSQEEVDAFDASNEAMIRSMADTPISWCFYYHKRPAAILGASLMHSGVFSFYGFGTDQWLKVWRSVTLVAKRGMMQAVRDMGAHRGQCLSLAHHKDTHRWLRFLGATHEAELPKFGANREDFIMFSWFWE